MIVHSLFIKARFCPVFIERLLRVTRHRGFKVCMLNTSIYNENNTQQINIILTVSSNKALNLLSTQLNKLIDIKSITEI